MRVINIDEDTAVGFDYEAQYYFITNMGTTTTRTTIQDTLNVLNIVAPDHTVTENDLISLATDMESLKDLYYTWSDDGSYIKTIQLNDYFKYPLSLDAEKSKLYIMNSTTIFDLTLNEGRRERLEQIQAFYRDTLGLLVALQDLQVLYMLLVHFYNPTCYNQITVIESETQPDSYSLFYNNTLQLSNYRGTSPATYTCTLNPDNSYNYETIAQIRDIEGNAITLTLEAPSQIQEGSKINISNTTTQVDISSYSADGTYTVQSINNNIIYTTENLPATFHTVFPILYIEAYKNSIVSISRDNQTITLTNSATDYLIGDTIIVKDAKVITDYETLSLDGFYSIIGIEGNVLTVDETPLTDYEATAGQEHYVFKPIPTLTVSSIEGDIITVVENTFPSTIQANTPVVIYTTIEGEVVQPIQYATITTLYAGENKLKVDTELIDNVVQYGLLRQPIPYTDTLINVINSKKESVLPKGEFLVITPNQAIDYLNLLENLTLPSLSDLSYDENNIGNFNSCNTQVRNYYIINTVAGHVNYMNCLGIYSKVYKEGNYS